jgi:hypothetical protein
VVVFLVVQAVVLTVVVFRLADAIITLQDQVDALDELIMGPPPDDDDDGEPMPVDPGMDKAA